MSDQTPKDIFVQMEVELLEGSGEKVERMVPFDQCECTIGGDFFIESSLLSFLRRDVIMESKLLQTRQFFQY